MSTMTTDQIVKAALNPPQRNNAKALRIAVAWIEDHEAARFVSIIALHQKPQIFLNDWKYFQNLFGNRKATITKRDVTWEYTVDDGEIVFQCTRWDIQENRNPEEGVVPPLPA